MEEIGYAIDFKEIKRVGCQWIDDILDHGMLLNPQDTKLIETTKDYSSKYWLMSLNGEGQYCNPSVENIAKEVFLAMEVLFSSYENLSIHRIIIYETPNCSTICSTQSISTEERINWQACREEEIVNYAQEKGMFEYDDRKL
jgi:6-pyruvoyltetrahydropterin/6-carboxytetrahydropterin synthase